jgi:hypothetical protein
VQKAASHEVEDVQEAAHLAVQDFAHEGVQATAHLNTGNVESGNRSQEVVHPSEAPRVRTAKGKQKEPGVRRTRLTEDWQPSERNTEFAIQCGLSEEAIPREAVNFKNYYIAKGATMLDWGRAWQNWCIRAVEYADELQSKQAQRSRSLVAGLLPADSPHQWGCS